MKLRKIDENTDIYLSLESQNSRNLPIISIEGKTFYRFMDCLYIPDRVGDLSLDNVIKLNSIRDDCFSRIADKVYNLSVIRTVLENIKSYLPEASAILDFGCGTGKTLKYLREYYHCSKIIGLDIRETDSIHNYDKRLTIAPQKEIPLPDGYFELCLSFFVFQFNIYDNQILELYRLISERGYLAFNLINSADFSIIERLDSFGFKHVDDFEIQTINNAGIGIIMQKYH